jgi:hypothetical protein
MALWDWTNGNFSLSQITRELEEAKAKGMGGFDIWDVGTFVDEKKIVPAGPSFMSDPSLQAIGHAVREADRLQMRLGLITASSWNDGGSWVKPEQGAMGLFRSTLTVKGPQAFSGKLPFPSLPDKVQKRRMATLIDYGPDGLPTFYKEVGVIAIPAEGAALDSNQVLDSTQVIVLSGKLDTTGKLTWQVPPGRWLITRYVCAPTGQPLMLPSPNSNGRIIDHFSGQATAAHLNFLIEKLENQLGPLRNRSLEYLYSDSYEVSTAIWTPALAEQFYKRVGYDMRPYLPVLDGKIVESHQISDRFLFDYKKLLSDLIIENHYALATAICNKHGLGYYAEAGGPGPPVHNVPFEDLRALGALTVPRGEFWRDHKDIEKLQIVKGIASAAHLYNQKYVEAESFTSVYVWQEGPRQLKPLADRAFCEGLNRIVYHTFPHTPPEAGSPGWVYNFGTLIHLNNSWWEKSRSFHTYLARCSYLLQQGNFVGDVAFYYGDRAPNFVTPKHVYPSLGPGYDYDVVNSESILKRMTVRQGRIYLPHGQYYQVLVLPDQDAINLQVLQKLEQLVQAGATVIGRKPTRTYGLHNYRQKESQVRAITNRLWGKCDSVHVKESVYGKGKIVWGKTIRQVLGERGVGPDFEFRSDQDSVQDSARVDYIHRRTGQDDIYFIRNTRNAACQARLTFRAAGKTPQLWHPAEGTTAALTNVRQKGGTTDLSIRLEPFESVFIVFRKEGGSRQQVWATAPALAQTSLVPVQTIQGGWEIHFPHGWRTPARMPVPELISWTASADTNVQHFSGVAAYHTSFDLPEAGAAGKRLFLDLGQVREIADVWLNGHHLGERCFLPYRYEVSRYIRPGRNHLVVEVANVLNNRMVGDARLAEPYRRTRSNLIKGPTAWTRPWAEVPLIESGLLGPVRILTEN